MLYESGSEVRFLNFKASGEDNIKWFSLGNLKSSSWNDLTNNRQDVLKHFAIQGDKTAERSFEISKKYGGCPNDAGWLVITNYSEPKECTWGKQNPGTNIIYSNTTKFENYQKGE